MRLVISLRKMHGDQPECAIADRALQKDMELLHRAIVSCSADIVNGSTLIARS